MRWLILWSNMLNVCNDGLPPGYPITTLDEDYGDVRNQNLRYLRQIGR